MKIQKPPMAVRVLLGIVSVLLCIALFCTTVLTLVVADLKVLTGKNALQTIITQLLFTAPKKNGPVYLFQASGAGGVRLDDPTIPSLPDGLLEGLPGVLPEGGIPSDEGGSTQFVVDAIYEYLKEGVGESLPVSKEDVSQLLEESTIPEFLSDKASSVVSDIIKGENTTTITKDEILNLVEENKEIIEKVTGTEIPAEVIDQIVTAVEEVDVVATVKDTVEVQLGLKPSPPAVDPETGETIPGTDDGTANGKPVIKDNVIQGVLAGDYSVQDVVDSGPVALLATLREITADSVLFAMLGVCLMLIALLFAANYWKLHAALRGAGISLMLAALPFALVNAVIMAAPAMFADPVLKVVATVVSALSGVSFGTFFGGLAMLVGSIVWGSLRAKKLRKASQPVAVPAVETVEIHPVLTEEAPALDITEDEE